MTTCVDVGISWSQIQAAFPTIREHQLRRYLRRAGVEPLRRIGFSFVYPSDSIEVLREQLRERDDAADGGQP